MTVAPSISKNPEPFYVTLKDRAPVNSSGPKCRWCVHPEVFKVPKEVWGCEIVCTLEPHESKSGEHDEFVVHEDFIHFMGGPACPAP